MLLVIYAYDPHARAAYFQQKYPGLSPDEIADILTSVTTRYAGVAGGVAGAGATAGQLSTLGTFGMTAPIFVGAIGVEMIYLARIQMRLILDLSVVYDLRLAPEDPEDVLMVFGYALRVAPTEMLGAATREAARGGTRTLVRKYVSKHVLKAIQSFARKLGFKVLQRTITKSTVPVASAAVGSSYNYVATRTMGKIAKTHFRHRAEFTGELRHLLSPERTYGPIFPAAVLYMVRIDGNFSSEEHELYKAMLSRITLSEYTQSEFQRLLDDETALVEAASGLRGTELQRSLVEMVTLMAACDGEITESEREFLVGLATVLECPWSWTSSKPERRTTGSTASRAWPGEPPIAPGRRSRRPGGGCKGSVGPSTAKVKITSQMNTRRLQRSLHNSPAVPQVRHGYDPSG